MKKINEFFTKMKAKSKPSSRHNDLAPSTSSPKAEASSSSSISVEKLKTAAAEAAERRQAQHLEKNKKKIVKKSTLLEKEEITEIKSEPEQKINEDDAHKFNCPSLGLEVYSSLDVLRKQMIDKIKSNFGEDPIICASLLIRNCNPKDQANKCISTFETILNNLRTDDEESWSKFSKLRKSKIESKILSSIGGVEFLNSIGFNISEDGEWFILHDSKDGLEERLLYYLDLLASSEVFPIMLDRETCVIDLNELNTPNLDFDDNIFAMNRDELIREQQSRKEIADEELTLRTKAMREKFPKREAKTYIRLRYKRLDCKMIEATFKINETVNDFIKWLKTDHAMANIENYDLTCGTQTIPAEDWDKTFLDLGFYPKVTFYQKMKKEN